ncbi:MAG: tRNA (adenosine(37)-N6)-threonylcarbamoyltransferase complex ATPase subunit type 1 TsaE [Rhizobiales bacterium]|nr:tRNA (adenosine(37)-N6)-threonylcarbamoyltransferase complex ATPase subunit type 1 TsaE [Hyphomicrobiales bacterium]
MSAQPIRWVIDLADEAATIAAAARLAGELRAGDLVTLGGPLGAGKTTFARALIRTLLSDPQAEVPSPTYTLLQTYEGPRFNIVHADLYRIADPAELAELGWEDAAENALVLVEWAERAGDILATDRLEVELATTGPTGAGRRLTLSGYGSFSARLERAKWIQTLLDRTGFGDARRDFMMGDASVRAYERLWDESSGRRGILMIAPRRPDGPPIRLGKPYSQLVHLAESVHAFVAIANGLRAEGFSAPEIYGADLDAGLLVIEDLGPLGVVDENGPMPERYRASVEALAELHTRTLASELPVADGLTHKLYRYDLEALTIEAELLLDWYFPYSAKRSPNASQRLSFVDHWVSTLEPVLSGPKTWTLRDYHSPNLIWLPEREGIRQVGIIDFQDCVLGHPAYDVASLLQDARVTVPEPLELQLLGAYARARRLRDPAFDVAAFTAAYAILGAQRATKILGIFIRLDRRDGKPTYLKHLPRVEAYLRRCLAHPSLAKLRGWYETNLPALILEAEPTHERAQTDPDGDAAGGGPRHEDAPTHG